MADPRVFDNPVAVAQDEALAALLALLGDVPDAQQTFAERYGNPNLLPFSPATLVEAARDDGLVRASHGQAIMLQAFAHVLTAQQRRIEELEAKASAKPEPELKAEAPAKPTTATTKPKAAKR